MIPPVIDLSFLKTLIAEPVLPFSAKLMMSSSIQGVHFQHILHNPALMYHPYKSPSVLWVWNRSFMTQENCETLLLFHPSITAAPNTPATLLIFRHSVDVIPILKLVQELCE